ncbi:hypothetical protein DM02DRAFT_628565 [Periconia macrospinosa]|uniref:Uncharacterized protein n=1 Tax=Periconia macrospinosa TaxID=97972 RepID=A0A2V1DST0_9PLEO|nr:hypothetical protein DM02DRAFT_628565 [Periconia macrospinosa]
MGRAWAPPLTQHAAALLPAALLHFDTQSSLAYAILFGDLAEKRSEFVLQISADRQTSLSHPKDVATPPQRLTRWTSGSRNHTLEHGPAAKTIAPDGGRCARNPDFEKYPPDRPFFVCAMSTNSPQKHVLRRSLLPHKPRRKEARFTTLPPLTQKTRIRARRAKAPPSSCTQGLQKRRTTYF